MAECCVELKLRFMLQCLYASMARQAAEIADPLTNLAMVSTSPSRQVCLVSLDGYPDLAMANTTHNTFETAFGPASRQRQFDFTVLFEQSILSILPSALFLSSATVVWWKLRKQRRFTISHGFWSLKVASRSCCQNHVEHMALLIDPRLRPWQMLSSRSFISPSQYCKATMCQQQWYRRRRSPCSGRLRL